MITACLIYCDYGEYLDARDSIAPHVDSIVAIKSTSVLGAHFESDCKCGCGSVAGDILDFSVARNASFAQAETDWITWIDCDDAVEPGQGFVAERLETSLCLTDSGSVGTAQRVLFPYQYAADSTFYLPRLVRKGETWKYPVHELLSGGTSGMRSEAFRWIHRRSPENTAASARRNFRLLTHHMTTGGNLYEHDSRMWMFFGFACLDLQKWIAAVDKLQHAFRLSRWDEERAYIATTLARRLPNDPNLMGIRLEWAWKAAKERPDWPSVWRTLATLHSGATAQGFFDHAASLPAARTLLPQDPREG